MDLSTIATKLKDGKYGDRSQFRDDFKLMIANAKLYNLAGSHVHNEANAFETFFDKRTCTPSIGNLCI
jgi:transcription initiation factor TFIID subunit 2